MTDRKTFVYVLFAVSGILLFFSGTTATTACAAHDSERYIALGIEKINEEKYEEALEYLEKAMELSSENPEAAYYAGIAYARTGDLERAEQLFLRVAVDEQYAENVQLELGRLYFIKNECRNAEDHLRKFMSFTEDPLAENYAEKMIDSCHEKELEDKPYHLTASLGAQYDSNVILEPDNPIVDEGDEEDGRVVALISGGLSPYRDDLVGFNIEYDFYQSLHFDLDDFNVQYHKLSPGLELTLSDFLKPSAGYNLEYITFGGDSYGVIHTYYGIVSVIQHECCSVDGIFEYRDMNYLDTDEFPFNSDRKGYERTGGVEQRFRWNKLEGDIYYFYSDKTASEDQWSYIGNRTGTTLNYRIMKPLLIKALAEYERRNYQDEFPGVVKERLDRMQNYSLSLQYSLSRRTALTLTGNYTDNDSNLDEFEYDRTVVGLFFSMKIL